jgi:putative ubiquitin-RnfH superfamily antitoxin RatB of RatAB toxin-antitoxin module
MLRIEVAYSPEPGQVDLSVLALPEGSTVGDALAASGLLQRHPEIARAQPRVGVWGRACTLQKLLRERDRVEVYRGLRVDPKEARRLRYRAQPKKPRRAP